MSDNEHTVSSLRLVEGHHLLGDDQASSKQEGGDWSEEAVRQTGLNTENVNLMGNSIHQCEAYPKLNGG